MAYLAPSLAHNLGLALHLWPLLRGEGGGGGEPAAPPGNHYANGSSSSSSGSGSSSGSSSTAAGPHRVRIQRYNPAAAQPAQQQQGEQWHSVPQPGNEPALVPVATEAHISIVRTPAPALLRQAPGSSEAADAAPAADGATEGCASAGGQGSRAAEAADDADGSPAAAADKGSSAADAVSALQAWFIAARRVVQEGDLLAVPRPPPGSSSGAGSLLPLLLPNLHAGGRARGAGPAATAPPQLLYFRVARLVAQSQPAGPDGGDVAPAAAVDVATTAVKLVGSCSSGLPVGLPHYLAAATRTGSSSSGGTSALLGVHALAAAVPRPLLPAVGPLLPAWRPLAQLLASVLHPGSAGVPLRLAVLLHGPPGSGKRTAAAAAAAAVGCHLVSLSSHDVKAAAGAAERHTFEGLRAAFGAAAEYAPALLLLRDFSALGDASSHGGSAGASAQSYAARLGSVLADCIRTHGGSGGGGGSSSSGLGATNSNSSGGGQAAARRSAHPAPVVLVAAAASLDDLPAPLRRCFTHELAVGAPDAAQRQALLAGGLGGVATGPDLAAPAAGAATNWTGSSDSAAAAAAAADGRLQGGVGPGASSLEETARHTAGLLPRELRAVAADAAAAAALQALPPAAVLGCGDADGSAAAEGGSPALLSQQHLAAAVDAVRARTATDIGEGQG